MVKKALILMIDEFEAVRPSLSQMRTRMGIHTSYREHRDLEKVDSEREVPDIAAKERSRRSDLLEFQKWLDLRWDELGRPG